MFPRWATSAGEGVGSWERDPRGVGGGKEPLFGGPYRFHVVRGRRVSVNCLVQCWPPGLRGGSCFMGWGTVSTEPWAAPFLTKGRWESGLLEPVRRTIRRGCVEGLGLCMNDPMGLTTCEELGTGVCVWWAYMFLCYWSWNGLSLASGDHGVGDCLTDLQDASAVLLALVRAGYMSPCGWRAGKVECRVLIPVGWTVLGLGACGIASGGVFPRASS